MVTDYVFVLGFLAAAYILMVIAHIKLLGKYRVAFEAGVANKNALRKVLQDYEKLEFDYKCMSEDYQNCAALLSKWMPKRGDKGRFVSNKTV